MKRILLTSVIAFTLVAGLGILEASAAPLEIVEVNNRALDCQFHESCVVMMDEYTDKVVLTNGTTGLLHTRTFIGQPGIETEGHFGYEYQLDMRNALGITGLPCVKTLTIDFGHVVNAFDYDRDGNVGDDVYVITTGNTGSIGIASANKIGPTTVFTFEEPVCSGDTPGSGDLTYTFGMVSGAGPHFRNVSMRETPIALDRTVEARSPILAEQVNRVSMENFDMDGDRRLSDSEFFNAIDLWLTQSNVPGTDESLDDIVFFNLIDWWIGGSPLTWGIPSPLPIRGNGAASTKLAFSNEQLTLQMPTRASIELSLFDISGKLVLTESAVGSQLRFRALDNSGNSLANGVYLYQVITRDAQNTIKSEIKKIAIIR